MHLLVRQTVSIDEADQAVDLEQTPGEVVVLSFTDSDLAALAAAWAPLKTKLPSLRLASLQRLRHPMSADIYVDDIIAKARFVIVRLLGGADYWRYGLDQITTICRRKSIALAVVPGDGRPDDRLKDASTVSAEALSRIDAWLSEGGPDNLTSLLCFCGAELGKPLSWQEPRAVAPAGFYKPAGYAVEGQASASALIQVSLPGRRHAAGGCHAGGTEGPRRQLPRYLRDLAQRSGSFPRRIKRHRNASAERRHQRDSLFCASRGWHVRPRPGRMPCAAGRDGRHSRRPVGQV